MQIPTEIDEVVRRLDDVIEWARAERSPLGYFAALYRRVTLSVGQGIEDGVFDDGPRMARLDLVFAQRYIDAFDAWRAGTPTTSAWSATFDQAARWRPIVVQHLLGGMNAHINLDLGIAAATVAPGDALPDLRADFMKINAVLAALVQGTKDQLARIWRPLKWLDALAGEVDDAVINFSMTLARDGAWSFAECLAARPEAEWPDMIATRDAVIGGRIADLVYRPGFWPDVLLLIVRLGERGTVDGKIAALTGAVAMAEKQRSAPTG